MTTLKSVFFALPIALLAGSVLAGDLPKSKQTKAELYVTAAEAADLLKSEDVFLVDVRSRAEVAFVGLPTRADKHIPYMVMPMMAEFDSDRGAYALEINPDFPADFEDFIQARGAGKDSVVILMCRSGSRSARAADLLADLGYLNVYSMIDGFEGDKAKDGSLAGQRVLNGWRNAGLGWSYKISPEQVYDADL